MHSQLALRSAAFLRFVQVVLLISLGFVTGFSSGVAGAQSPPADADMVALRDAIAAGGIELLPAAAGAWPPADLVSAALDSGAAALPLIAGESWERIVFSSWRDGNWEIYAANADGTALLRLTVAPGIDVRPRMTQDKARVAFVSDRSGNYDIYSMRPDGSDMRQLTVAGERDDYPAWSPDGRRIAFSRLHNGTFDLFVMNADGSGQSQITDSGPDDVWPAWSPDGRQIAWASNQGTAGILMVANADGSAARAVASGLTYLQHPTWSRDGTLIAFDSDVDHDIWNELQVIQPDGTGRRTIYDLSRDQAEVYMNAWSPNGSQILANLVFYTMQNPTPVLAAAAVVRLSASGGAFTTVLGGSVDMSADWQPPDLAAPSASMSALPAVSPAPILVQWQGQDVGPAGVESYNVQVRTGASSDWTDWLNATPEMSRPYPGRGNQAYEFRVRARDRAGNVGAWPATAQAYTTIEGLKPVSRIGDTSPFLKANGIVPFTGYDLGGSGIAYFNGEYRDLAEGGWNSFASGVTSGAAPFWPGVAEHRYALRSQAVDKAGNAELPHSDAGDTVVTQYSWAAMGKVTDNAGTPLAGVVVSTSLPAFAGGPSGADGSYSVYVGGWEDNYQISWSKVGYGALPAASYPRLQDALLDVVLPPADNVVANWGFEEGLAAPWTADGLAPVTAADAAHTGAAGARLGYVPFLN